MKKLRTFAHQSEAHLAKALLGSHGITAQIIDAKEYTAHLLGGDAGSYSLMVDEEDMPTAKKLIDEVMAKDMSLSQGEPNYFRKAVFFAIGALVLIPVVFNVVSLLNAYKYWENSEKEAGDAAKVLFVVALQIPTYFALKFMFGMVSDISSMLTVPEEY